MRILCFLQAQTPTQAPLSPIFSQNALPIVSINFKPLREEHLRITFQKLPTDTTLQATSHTRLQYQFPDLVFSEVRFPRQGEVVIHSITVPFPL